MALSRMLGFSQSQRTSDQTAARAGNVQAERRADAGEALLLLRSFEEAGHGWFWSTDSNGNLTYVSHDVALAFGPSYEEVIGSRFADLVERADDDLNGRSGLPFILAKESQFAKIIVRPVKRGDLKFWSMAGTPQRDTTGRFTGFRGIALDVTEQRRSSLQASHLARYDSLTGLPNRRVMSEVLDSTLPGVTNHKKPCAVMLIDLDRFKQVNDTMGHPAGDALLKQVAERLLIIAGDRERVFRLGGDEFQIIVPNCDDRGELGKLASRTIDSLSQPYSIEGSRCIIGASIGIAIAPTDGVDRSELIRNADLALYASKEGGRGRFKFFSSDLSTAAEERRQLEEDLRDGLARDELSLWYQPIVNATTNHITGVEALLRWNHPVRGLVSPTIFIPIAEEAGLITRIGTWIIRQACEDAVKWPGKLRVAVNISPLQFADDALPATVLSALAASGLAPDRLELEITEGVFLAASVSTDTAFQALKDIGVRLALDDFGTGYSSLGYLRTAPFDKIKIDQTFVREATLPGSKNKAIIAAIVALAEALDMETTAEGIEYMDQLSLIRSLRVSHVQGWVYSKALTSDDLCDRLTKGELILKPSGPAKQRSERQAVYRAAGVLHGNRYISVIVRNLSESGALLDGNLEAPVGSLIVVDFGDGQLTYARVTRIIGRQSGIAFEERLVSDGDGGLCTSRRVSPYLLASMKIPAPGAGDAIVGDGEVPATLEDLAEKLGLTRLQKPARQVPAMNLDWAPAPEVNERGVPTLGEVAAHYLESISGDCERSEIARNDLETHVLPKFGKLRLDQVSQSDIFAWLAGIGEGGGEEAGTDSRLHTLLRQMWTLAARLELPGSESNPLGGSLRFDRRGVHEGVMTASEAERLLHAAQSSQNRQLKYILALLMLTGARPSELLKAQWGDIDLGEGVWRIQSPGSDLCHELSLSATATTLLAALPRLARSNYVVPNPVTGKPYRSVAGSWEAARAQADLPAVEIEDLRFCDLGPDAWQSRLLAILLPREGQAHIEPEQRLAG